MKRHTFKSSALLMLASFIVGVNLTGCAAAQGSLYSSVMPAGTNMPITVTTSTVPVDTTAPVIDAMDITIPYGTSLRPDEMASITDDQDESPVLEIASVLEIIEENGQNTATTAEGSTLSATASTADLIYESAATNEPDMDAATDSDSTLIPAAEAESASADVVTESAAVAAVAETTSTETKANIDSAADIIVVDPTTDTAVSNTTDAVISNTAAAAATATTLETPSEAATVETGYLFSTPGQYSVILKGTDKSGNESTKTITVSVTDNIAPVISGLPETISLTDKDKNAPDYLTGITATDEIDGDISAAIKVDDSAVQYGKAGSYSISYSVSDASGNEATATAPVVVKDTTAPYLAVIGSAFNLFVNDKKPDYAANVTAIDAVDGDVKDTLTVDDSSVKYKQPGEYDAKLRVEDKSGNAVEKTVKVSISAGWKTQNGKKYYYSLKDGHLSHGWSHIDDKLYYFDPDDGHMLTGLQTIEGKQYLLDKTNGYQLTGWQTIDGKKYYFAANDGHMYHSWSHVEDKLYYFDPDDGHMVTGAQTIDGKEYLLDETDGHAITGWQTVNGKKYYYSPDDGHMYHSWSNIGGKDYYFDPAKGCMLTGLLTINGGQYLLDESDGHQLTGWQTIGGNKYYFSPNDGHMYHDWSNIDGTEYYFDTSDGHMYTGKHYVDGEEYDFGTSGAATKVVQTRSTASSGSGGSYGITYIGNKNSHKFHYESCSSVRQMNDSNKVYLDSRDEAISRGYKPCQRCNP